MKTIIEVGKKYLVRDSTEPYGTRTFAVKSLNSYDKEEALVYEDCGDVTRRMWVDVKDYDWLPFPSEDSEDAIVNNVIEKYKKRSAEGIKKYGTTLDANPASLKEWLNHLQEELMDASLYCQRLLEEV